MQSKEKAERVPAWLIDSSIYVFKAWFTRPQSNIDKEGHPVDAVLGFIDFVYKLLLNEQPKLIAFAFDESLQKSHRRDIYPAYKANRAPAPESLKKQFQYCRSFIQAIGLHQDASPYYEADDLIGTWAASLREQSIPANFITADKDLAQLVVDNDWWWEYERGEPLNIKKITKRFKAMPHQIADQLALAGDKSDNIPGISGVGMATAGKLLKKFDSLEGLFENIEEVASMQIRGALQIQQSIIENIEQVRLARKLTTIEKNIVDVDNSIFRPSGIDKHRFSILCEQLNLSDKEAHKWLTLEPLLND